MTRTTIIIIVVVALLLIAVIAAGAMSARKKKQEQNRIQAAELREKATAQAAGLQQQDARARETEAAAAQARAEADRKAAEAERLEAEAADHHNTLADSRTRHEENLMRADELDPDVDHKAAQRNTGATYTSAVDRTESHDGATSNGNADRQDTGTTHTDDEVPSHSQDRQVVESERTTAEGDTIAVNEDDDSTGRHAAAPDQRQV